MIDISYYRDRGLPIPSDTPNVNFSGGGSGGFRNPISPRQRARTQAMRRGFGRRQRGLGGLLGGRFGRGMGVIRRKGQMPGGFGGPNMGRPIGPAPVVPVQQPMPPIMGSPGGPIGATIPFGNNPIFMGGPSMGSPMNPRVSQDLLTAISSYPPPGVAQQPMTPQQPLPPIMGSPGGPVAGGAPPGTFDNPGAPGGGNPMGGANMGRPMNPMTPQYNPTLHFGGLLNAMSTPPQQPMTPPQQAQMSQGYPAQQQMAPQQQQQPQMGQMGQTGGMGMATPAVMPPGFGTHPPMTPMSI